MSDIGISTIGQQNSTLRLLGDLRENMDTLQKQVVSGRRADTFDGLEDGGLRTLRARNSITMVDTYIQNITIASTRISVMDTTLEDTAEMARDLLDGFKLEPLVGSSVDTAAINIGGETGLVALEAYMNENVDGRYIFSGANVDTKPFQLPNTLKNTIQSELSDWMDGTQTEQEMFDNLDNLTDAQIGLSTTLASAGSVTVRADDNVDVDYTVKGNHSGFRKVMIGFAIAESLTSPDPATDIPDMDDFTEVFNKVKTYLSEGAKELDQEQFSLGVRHKQIISYSENHTVDRNTFQSIVSEEEEVDMALTITKLNAVYAQLEASYNVTKFMNDMSLVNVLR